MRHSAEQTHDRDTVADLFADPPNRRLAFGSDSVPNSPSFDPSMVCWLMSRSRGAAVAAVVRSVLLLRWCEWCCWWRGATWCGVRCCRSSVQVPVRSADPSGTGEGAPARADGAGRRPRRASEPRPQSRRCWAAPPPTSRRRRPPARRCRSFQAVGVPDLDPVDRRRSRRTRGRARRSRAASAGSVTRPCLSAASAEAPANSIRMKSRARLLVTGAWRSSSVKLRNSALGHTYRQRSCPRVTTSPSDSSSLNFAGRKSRPLSSSRGVWVPKNIPLTPLSATSSISLHCTPLSPTHATTSRASSAAFRRRVSCRMSPAPGRIGRCGSVRAARPRPGCDHIGGYRVGRTRGAATYRLLNRGGTRTTSLWLASHRGDPIGRIDTAVQQAPTHRRATSQGETDEQFRHPRRGDRSRHATTSRR